MCFFFDLRGEILFSLNPTPQRSKVSVSFTTAPLGLVGNRTYITIVLLIMKQGCDELQLYFKIILLNHAKSLYKYKKLISKIRIKTHSVTHVVGHYVVCFSILQLPLTCLWLSAPSPPVPNI